MNGDDGFWVMFAFAKVMQIHGGERGLPVMYVHGIGLIVQLWIFAPRQLRAHE